MKRHGDVIAVNGPFGAGKTTSIEILEGLMTPDAGDVEVRGKRWTTDPAWMRARLGIQLQETQLADKLTVRETPRLFRSSYDDGFTIDELLATVELDGKRDTLGRQALRRSASTPVDCVRHGRPARVAVFWTNRPPGWTPSPAVSCGAFLRDSSRAAAPRS